MPDSAACSAHHDQMAALLRTLLPEVLYLGDVVGDHDSFESARSNPNHVFTRDSMITIPWIPDGYIAARMTPPQRPQERVVAGEALRRLGLRKPC